MITPYQVNALLGNQLYQVQRNWPYDSLNLKGICDVKVLANGNVALLRRASPQIIIVSPSGELLEEWEIPNLISAHYMSARKNGGLLIADLCSHVIITLDNNGKQIGELGHRGKPGWGEPFNNPTSAIEDDEGRIYVTDGYGNSCLHCFNPDGTLRFTIGKRGTGKGEFSTSHAVVITQKGEVFVGDRENSRIQVFNREGEWVRQIDTIYKPMGIALLDEDKLIVSDQTPSVSLISTQGKLLGRSRTYGVYGHGVGVGDDGAIYIAEMSPDSITKLNPISV